MHHVGNLGMESGIKKDFAILTFCKEKNGVGSYVTQLKLDVAGLSKVHRPLWLP